MKVKWGNVQGKHQGNIGGTVRGIIWLQKQPPLWRLHIKLSSFMCRSVISPYREQ